MRRKELNKKIQQSRMKQLAMEEELQQWRENMDIIRKMVGQHSMICKATV